MEKIIKKKLLLIVSMLAVTFALAGCSSSDKKVEFDYDGNTLVQIAETQATNYMQIAQVEDVYNFYVDEEANGGQVDETTADALKVFSTIESDYGKFQQFKPVNLEDEDDKTIQEVDDKVVVTLYAECAEKEAIVKATFVDNSVTYNFQKYSVMAQNQYSEEEADQMLASNGVYPYKISEFEVAANQTLKDKMKDAGANTLIGMGIVFIALIFISFIISLLKYVPALLDKETREKRKAEKAKKALGSVATLNVDKEDETPAGSAPAPAGIVDIVNTATGDYRRIIVMKNYRITVNGTSYDVSVEELSGGAAPVAAPVAAAPVAAPAAAPAAPAPAAGGAGSIKVSSPMPGKILAVKANVGDSVKKGQVILILEAMKMENEVVAPEDGTIASIDVTVGASVESGDTLATLN